jgi:hypothetical protein
MPGPAMLPNRGRYVLRMTDPLLPRPVYLELNRSPMTIGLHEGEISWSIKFQSTVTQVQLPKSRKAKVYHS